MTSELTPTYDSYTGQVVLEGLPAGPAGEAVLRTAPGLEMAFDRADGRLFRVVVETGPNRCSPVLAEATAAILTGFFGPSAPAKVRAAITQRETRLMLHPDTHLSAICSRLARLGAARGTSPVPALPLWAAEAAQLAEQAGLQSRARAEARRAVGGLAEIFDRGPLPEEFSVAALAVADIAEDDQPDAAKLLRDKAEKQTAEARGSRLTDQAGASEPPGVLASLSPAGEEEHAPRWSLDRGLFPEGVLLPALSPISDLSVHATTEPGGKERVIVEAALAPGADRKVLGRCRARLVDPTVRRVLTSAPFAVHGPRARAELQPPFPLDELKQTWVEVVDDEHRPVQSERSRRIRRALRWADAALRAGQQPSGLAPQLTSEGWAALAADAWARCAAEWHEAGDAERAYLATRRLAAYGPTHVPKAPAAWVADLADHPQLSDPAFLAEALGR